MTSTARLLYPDVMAAATTTVLGNGFFDHGMPAPISNHRGIVTTVDGDGRDVVLVCLMDRRGGYAVLMIDAETGASLEFPTPYPLSVRDAPFASLLSSRNRFYIHFDSHFAEFDPVKRAYTFVHETTPQMSMGMTEDDAGRIWSVSYPSSGVVSYDPATSAFRDYGSVYEQSWAQYQRFVAADDAGWIYFGIGETHSQIIALDPDSGDARPLLAEAERTLGHATVYRDLDGKVYGQPQSEVDDAWMELYKGRRTDIGSRAEKRKKPCITGAQSLFHRELPNGRVVSAVDLVDRRLVIKNSATDETTETSFDYSTEGAPPMGLRAAPDGSICGGTFFPMRAFRYDPKTDELINRNGYGQWNTVACGGDRFFVGAYTHGSLLEWDPTQPWTPTKKEDPAGNPLWLTECEPPINRPHCLLAHPDGKTVVMGGTPGYGYTGGGLLFWDRETRSRILLEHTDVLPDHSTMSLLALPDGKLLGGTTIGAGTGGESKAEVAELYIMDIASKRVEWRAPVLPKATGYTDLCPGPAGLIYGLADQGYFFVFDPSAREIRHEEDLFPVHGVTCYQQGPRVFIPAPDGTVYMLLPKGIARIDPDSFAIVMVAESPVPVGRGGDFLDGSIYFASESRIYSYRLPE